MTLFHYKTVQASQNHSKTGSSGIWSFIVLQRNKTHKLKGPHGIGLLLQSSSEIQTIWFSNGDKPDRFFVRFLNAFEIRNGYFITSLDCFGMNKIFLWQKSGFRMAVLAYNWISISGRPFDNQTASLGCFVMNKIFL